MSVTIKTVAADKLTSILGSRIVQRTKSVRVQGEPTKHYTQTLLLLPKGILACLTLPSDAEPYVDKRSKEEFVAFVISETRPRAKVRVPIPPPNPMMGVRLIIGQGVWHEDNGWGFVPGPLMPSDEEVGIMSQGMVRIVRTSTLSPHTYGRVISQLALASENARLVQVHKALQQLGTPTHNLNFLQAVPATQEDSVRLLSYKDGRSHVQLTPEDANHLFDAFIPEDQGSLHSSVTTLRKDIDPHLQLARKLGMSSERLAKLEREFDAREPSS